MWDKKKYVLTTAESRAEIILGGGSVDFDWLFKMPPSFVGVLCLVLYNFAIISLGKKREREREREKERESWLLYFNCLLFSFMSCGNLCFVYLSHGVVSWSGVCDCGISWSCSLTLYTQFESFWSRFFELNIKHYFTKENNKTKKNNINK